MISSRLVSSNFFNHKRHRVSRLKSSSGSTERPRRRFAERSLRIAPVGQKARRVKNSPLILTESEVRRGKTRTSAGEDRILDDRDKDRNLPLPVGQDLL
jgi:hypothetical protein